MNAKFRKDFELVVMGRRKEGIGRRLADVSLGRKMKG